MLREGQGLPYNTTSLRKFHITNRKVNKSLGHEEKSSVKEGWDFCIYWKWTRCEFGCFQKPLAAREPYCTSYCCLGSPTSSSFVVWYDDVRAEVFLTHSPLIIIQTRSSAEGDRTKEEGGRRWSFMVSDPSTSQAASGCWFEPMNSCSIPRPGLHWAFLDAWSSIEWEELITAICTRKR